MTYVNSKRFYPTILSEKEREKKLETTIVKTDVVEIMIVAAMIS